MFVTFNMSFLQRENLTIPTWEVIGASYKPSGGAVFKWFFAGSIYIIVCLHLACFRLINTKIQAVKQPHIKHNKQGINSTNRGPVYFIHHLINDARVQGEPHVQSMTLQGLSRKSA
jgi:hypothetical protein